MSIMTRQHMRSRIMWHNLHFCGVMMDRSFDGGLLLKIVSQIWMRPLCTRKASHQCTSHHMTHVEATTSSMSHATHLITSLTPTDMASNTRIVNLQQQHRRHGHAIEQPVMSWLKLTCNHTPTCLLTSVPYYAQTAAYSNTHVYHPRRDHTVLTTHVDRNLRVRYDRCDASDR